MRNVYFKNRDEELAYRYYCQSHSDLLDRCFRCRSKWVDISRDGKIVCDHCGYEIETVTSRIAEAIHA